MATPPLRDHPALQFWPSFWSWEGEGLATVFLARSKNAATFALSTSTWRGTSVSWDIHRWARGKGVVLQGLTTEEDEALRTRVLDGKAWLEIWTLWPWGWAKDSSTLPYASLPSPEELDAAVERLVPDLPKALPIVPNRWTQGLRP